MFERNHFLSAILEMTSSLDVCLKQRAVIEFLVWEGEPPINIFIRSEKVYRDAAIGCSAVKKWVSRIKSEEENPSLSDFRDKQRSGRPSAAVNPGNSVRVKELIRDDHGVTIDDIDEHLGISYRSAAQIVGELGFLKVCVRLFPRQLNGRQKVSSFRSLFEASLVSLKL